MRKMLTLLFSLFIFQAVFAGEKPSLKKKEDKYEFEEKKASKFEKLDGLKKNLSYYYITEIKKLLKKETLSQKDIEKAKTIYKETYESNYTNTKPYANYLLALIQHKKGLTELALNYLNRIPYKGYPIDLSAKIHTLKAELYFKQGRYSKSRGSIYKASKAVGKFTPEMNFLLGAIELENGDISAAFKKFESIIKSSKDTSLLINSYNKLAICYLKNKRTDDAVSNFEKALELKGSSNNGFKLEYLKLAESYLIQGNDLKSEEYLNLFMEQSEFAIKSPDEIEVFKNLSKKLKTKGEFEKAITYLEFHSQLTDSLLLSNSSINELYQLELLSREKEISLNAINSLVMEDELKAKTLSATRWAIGLLVVLLLIGLGAGIFILRVSKQRRIANQTLALRSLRSQMNPHFIFNALNSVNSFISENDQRSANKFLTSFSRLMRLVMENSEHDFIPLQKELEILNIYLQLEHFRFKDQFNYKIKLDKEIDEDEFNLPPMLIQPYIENAIWHGLRYKPDSGELLLELSQKGKDLIVTISDNGIGRIKSAELKTANQKKNKSTALRNIKQRIEIVNELHALKIEVVVNDLNQDGTGTVVKLTIPQKLS